MSLSKTKTFYTQNELIYLPTSTGFIQLVFTLQRLYKDIFIQLYFYINIQSDRIFRSECASLCHD